MVHFIKYACPSHTQVSESKATSTQHEATDSTAGENRGGQTPANKLDSHTSVPRPPPPAADPPTSPPPGPTPAAGQQRELSPEEKFEKYKAKGNDHVKKVEIIVCKGLSAIVMLCR